VSARRRKVKRVDKNELIQALLHGRVSRREFLKRAVAAGVSLSAAGALLQACGGGAGDEAASLRAQTVILDIDGGRVQSPTLWNPFVAGSRVDQGFQSALIEPLFTLNYETGEIEPWLGESFEPNEAQDFWTLKLRDGIKWSDGEDFDADDVVFTIRMLTEGPVELSNAAAMQEWVDSVEKLDKLTVEFRLKEPNPRFQLDYFSVKIWGSVYIVPQHIWSDKDPLTFKNYDKEQGWPVFTGPYRLVNVSPTEFVYERRDDWWGKEAGFKPLPKPQRLVWTANETEEIRVARASEHQLDSVMDMTTGAFESLKARNPDDIISWLEEKPYAWPDPCGRLFSLNHTVQPWGDAEMRWAVNHAIDRDEVVKIAYEGSTTPARFFFPPYPPLEEYVNLLEQEGLYEEFPLLEHNPDKAQQIIESKGYVKNGDYYEKDGKQLRVRVDAPDAFIEIKRIAQVVVEQLQRIGINATSRTLAVSTWGENLGLGKYEAVADWSACGSVNEPWSSMDRYHIRWVVPVGERAGGNVVRWKNEEYSDLVSSFAAFPLGDERIREPFVEAARVWFRELPFIPVTSAKKLYAFDTYYWTGWPTKENNYLHPTTAWNSAHKIIHNLKPAQR
jgi:peptide/nickel transport system substrate-binding protein